MQLSAGDVGKLEGLLSRGVQPVRTVRRALVLRLLGEGKSSPRIAASVGVVVNTVCEVRKRYEQGGLERALYDKPRPGAPPLLSVRQRQEVIAMVCGAAPAGRARWSVADCRGSGASRVNAADGTGNGAGVAGKS